MNQRVYLDENFIWAAHIQVLRGGGLDVLPAGEAGMLGRSDEEHLLFAAAEGRLLVSYDRRDYQILHAQFVEQRRQHGGILLVYRDANYSPGELLRRMKALFATFNDLDTTNYLLFLSNFG